MRDMFQEHRGDQTGWSGTSEIVGDFRQMSGGQILKNLVGPYDDLVFDLSKMGSLWKF